jgi:uncharacterized protein (DUF433 family)
MISAPPASSWIEKNSDICGGEACIRRTRIMVWLLVYLQRSGRSDAALLADYPGLAVDDLAAAWEYYRLHVDEIERDTWMNIVAAGQPSEEVVPAWAIVSGRLLGLSDETIRNAFDPPLAQANIDAAWESYRRNPRPIDEKIGRYRLAD